MSNIVQEIETLSGHTIRKVIRCARKGTIKSCRLVQWDDERGLYDGFTFSLWSATEACPPMLVANDDARLPADDWDRAQYQIGKTRSVDKGEDELKKDGEPDVELGVEYRNRDNNGSQTNMLRQIYLELKDLGPTDTERVKRYKLYMLIEPKSD